ncbi:MAG: UDP-N-acetylmuramoyl-L-alanyl-D-glutamate--2,6-diaminopimelate ligase [Kiritimatiellae bacterium]|nr:UDP-N-acetylmuramoyl-L-alanyl-D-glutamate--2,6-diaminopimelate ligase [Kiritimatiellia bacterium]
MQYSDVTSDSRKVTPGALFVAIPGVKVDGAQFIAQARERGVAAVMGECEGCDIRVPNAREAYAEACADFFNNPSEQLLLCGVTGTNGKTTTTLLLREMLAQGGLMPGLITTVAIEWKGHSEPASCTTPDARALQSTLNQMVTAGCRAAVMEVSSHAVEQRRVAGCNYAALLFTNLTQDHLDYHGTMEDYYQAKARLFRDHLSTPAVINIDDPYGARLLKELEAAGHQRLFPYSPQTIQARFSSHGTDATFQLDVRTLEFHTALCGRYNLANLLCAATAARALGVTIDAILYAMTTVRPQWGRLEAAVPGVFVDYAHTDDALSNVLSTLRELTRGRLICVFGCGGDRDRTKRPRMAAAVERFADAIIVTSDNPRTEDPEAIIAEIVTGFSPETTPMLEPDRRKAIHCALQMKATDDVILVAGKGHEDYQEIQGVRHPFSDAEVIRAFYA